MKILILNRRDIANPAGGGAELYTHEIARGLVEKYSCELVVFSTRFPDSAAEEISDGVRHVRKGNEATVHLWGLVYAFRNRKKFDLVVDEFNGLGFFTFVLPNSILLIHQMYKEFWFRELGAMGALPYVLEPLLLRLYRNRLAITVSESTKEDLLRRGFKKIRIVMNAIKQNGDTSYFQGTETFSSSPLGGEGGDRGISGTSNRPEPEVLKDAETTLVFLGRLKSTKRPEDALEIFRRVKARVPGAKLWIMGAGPLEGVLRKRAEGLADVTFWGWVREEEKMSLLGRAHILIVPSVREGFGINVIEAASAGCPAVGYNVPGLRDSIRHGETGYLTASPDEAATRIVELLGDPQAYAQMSRNCLEYARGFDWRKRVDEFWEVIKSIKE